MVLISTGEDEPKPVAIGLELKLLMGTIDISGYTE